ncbi:MAG: alpha/beta fold hydrolase, partial [Candidatus Dormibacteria bacterium]
MGSFGRLRNVARPLGALAGILGATAVVNRRLRDAGPLPTDELGGRSLHWRFRGYEIFTREFGAGPPILLVHGVYAGASSYEYRKLAPRLAERGRVLAFDLLGCGLSEMPKLRYT